VQNHTSTREYMRLISQGSLATERGIALNDTDRMRAFVIERLMCDFAFPERELLLRYGSSAQEILSEAQELLAADRDRLVERDGNTFRVTERGRPFVRSIAACFDTYFQAGAKLHASGV
jgi:oxygen-independent coproporphyrinogen-3 oxidase